MNKKWITILIAAVFVLANIATFIFAQGMAGVVAKITHRQPIESNIAPIIKDEAMEKTVLWSKRNALPNICSWKPIPVSKVRVSKANPTPIILNSRRSITSNGGN